MDSEVNGHWFICGTEPFNNLNVEMRRFQIVYLISIIILRRISFRVRSFAILAQENSVFEYRIVLRV